MAAVHPTHWLICAQVPANASFETHRGRPLGHAFQCQRILDAVPGLRLTADPSHWHVVHERFLDMNTRDERVLMNTVAGRVDHVHARVGNEERPQLVAPFDDAAADWHVAFWRRCWDAGARTACVELDSSAGSRSVTLNASPKDGCAFDVCANAVNASRATYASGTSS